MLRFCACTESQLANAHLAKWPDTHLPWAITDLVPGISEAELKAAVEWAVGMPFGWQTFCGIEPVYEETARNARLLITARRIDGPQGILAECELPMGQAQCRLWLDVSERWLMETLPTQRAILLPIVLRHEIGHGIGLGHAPDGSKNWMAPVYDPDVIRPGGWDIAESQQRYGGFRSPFPPTPLPPEKGTNMDRDTLRAVLQRYLRAAQFVASLTGTTIDDKIVSFLGQAVAEDWVLELLLILINRVGGRVSPEEMMQALAKVEVMQALAKVEVFARPPL